MRARERVARDLFAAFHALQQERMARSLCDSQIGAHGSQQIRRENIVNRNQVPVFRETLKFAKIRQDHRALRGLADAASARKTANTARRMAASGARRFIQISHCAAPCARNISTPETVAIPMLAASFKNCVLSGR